MWSEPLQLDAFPSLQDNTGHIIELSMRTTSLAGKTREIIEVLEGSNRLRLCVGAEMMFGGTGAWDMLGTNDRLNGFAADQRVLKSG